MRRTFLITFGVLLVAAVAAVLSLHLRNRARGDRLVDEVVRLSQARPRPVHRLPLAKQPTFEACLGPLLDRAPPAGLFKSGQAEELRSQVASICAGSEPIESLAPALRADLDRLLPWANEVTACSQAAAIGDEPGLGPFGDWNHPRQHLDLIPEFTVPRMVVLEMRDELSRGEATTALRRCADVLALGRDVVMDKGLVGAMLAERMTKMAVPACAAAIDRCDETARRSFLDELAIVRRGVIRFAGVMEIERAQMQLMAFGRFLSSDQVLRLPENSRALASDRFFDVGFGVKWVAAWLYWREFTETADRLVAAADSPTRDTLLSEIDKDHSVLEQILADGTPPGSMLGYAQRYDAMARGFDLLESAALVSLGEAPLASVKSVSAAGLTTLSVQWMKDETVSVEVRDSTSRPAHPP